MWIMLMGWLASWDELSSLPLKCLGLSLVGLRFAL
jgi:hypothetical protein